MNGNAGKHCTATIHTSHLQGGKAYLLFRSRLPVARFLPAFLVARCGWERPFGGFSTDRAFTCGFGPGLALCAAAAATAFTFATSALASLAAAASVAATSAAVGGCGCGGAHTRTLSVVSAIDGVASVVAAASAAASVGAGAPAAAFPCARTVKHRLHGRTQIIRKVRVLILFT